MSFGGSSSRSTPVDMTPEPYRRLQPPFADLLASYMGFQRPGFSPMRAPLYDPRAGFSMDRVMQTQSPGGGGFPGISPIPEQNPAFRAPGKQEHDLQQMIQDPRYWQGGPSISGLPVEPPPQFSRIPEMDMQPPPFSRIPEQRRSPQFSRIPEQGMMPPPMGVSPIEQGTRRQLPPGLSGLPVDPQRGPQVSGLPVQPNLPPQVSRPMSASSGPQVSRPMTQPTGGPEREAQMRQIRQQYPGGIPQPGDQNYSQFQRDWPGFTYSTGPDSPLQGPGVNGSGGGGAGSANPAQWQLGPVSQNPFLGFPVYEGPLAAGMSPNEQMILSRMMQSQGNMGLDSVRGFQNKTMWNGVPGLEGDLQGAGMAGVGAAGFARAGAGSGYNANDVNPFMQAAIGAASRPILQDLEQTLDRTLPGRFTAAGQFVQPESSSAFDRAAAVATRGAADALGDIGTNIAFQTTDAERNRQFMAQEGQRERQLTASERMLGAGQLGLGIADRRLGQTDRQLQAGRDMANMSQIEMQNMVQNLQAQALPRLIQEFGIERGIQQFNNQMQNLMVLLQVAGGVTEPVIANNQRSSGFNIGLF